MNLQMSSEIYIVMTFIIIIIIIKKDKFNLP